MPGYVSSNFTFSIKKKISSSSESWCTKKIGYWKTNNGHDHRKVKWKNHVYGSIPESYDKNAYKLSEKNSKIHQNLYVRW
jgi:hypothetical protein